MSVKMFTGAAFIWRLDCGWRFCFQDSSPIWSWLLAWGLSCSLCGPLYMLRYLYDMMLGFPCWERSKRVWWKPQCIFWSHIQDFPGGLVAKTPHSQHLWSCGRFTCYPESRVEPSLFWSSWLFWRKWQDGGKDTAFWKRKDEVTVIDDGRDLAKMKPFLDVPGVSQRRNWLILPVSQLYLWWWASSWKRWHGICT